MEDRHSNIETSAVVIAMERREAERIERETAAADAAAFRAEWTPEVTAARRAAWNAEVKSGKITPANYRDAEKRMGFTTHELAAAVNMHK